MRKTWALIETKNIIGDVAYVRGLSSSDNVLALMRDNKIKSISIYTSKKQAQEQADKLNAMFKERNTAQ